MKYLIILLITFPVFACQVQVPTSEAQRYIDALPNGVPPLWSCADKPDEECLCADAANWEIVEIVDEFITDPVTGINTSKKVLKNSDVKKALRKAERDAEKLADDEKKAKRKAAKDKVKAFNFKGTTIKELRDELNEYADENAKVVED